MGNHAAHLFERGGCFVPRESLLEIDESGDAAH
jgi:hypothetical protein